MRAHVQRVRSASVEIAGETVGSIGRGYLVLLGVGAGDTEAAADKLWSKLRDLRINEDDEGKTNRSLAEAAGEVLVVSQFTLYADCRRGRRPSFTAAAPPAEAERLYEHFVSLVRADLGTVETGRFGANMQVSLVNDGPFTVLLDTAEL
ncbi:D-aminoacyl-tRNA deacylase [Collinsella vaginalis]|uniref:D-aminoacyl-tRNA deacylase n=1 Tax=Collinsella vaginalis TaxID=1870987 RepID=UPI000A267C1D|nr:D-aminoacyl-tRNA deacylase [Collinsella vaginalis]